MVEIPKPNVLAFVVQRLAFVCIFPAGALVVWGELATVGELKGVNDKLQHLVAYFGLAFLTTLAFSGRRKLQGAVALVVMGAVLEILQGFVGRDPSILDALTGAAGVVAGLVAGYAAAFVLATLPDLPIVQAALARYRARGTTPD